jgi:WD40 repeat protein/tRNA A-37 threonylcarbamoyl transferase component Bud32
MEDLSGKQLGQYRIIEPLGRGGMASVFKAYQPGMDRYVAVKILPKAYASEPGFLARFQQEARVIANLEHPHIVPVHEFGEAEGYTYLVMRYVEGGTLANLLRGPQDLSTIKRIITQLASALDYAHQRGIIHRDIKPSNVLIDQQGNAQLTDFGLAKIVERTTKLTVSGAFLGTPKYASPEQGKSEPLSGRSDIYSLGVILYEMVTGKVPFEAETPLALLFKHVHDPLPLPRSVNPAVPEDLERIILKALAKDPADRYATAGELAQELIQIQADLQAATTLAQEVQPPAYRPRGLSWKWMGIVGLGIVLLGFFAFLVRPRPAAPTEEKPTPTAAQPTQDAQTKLPPSRPTLSLEPEILTPITIENLTRLREQDLLTRGTISTLAFSPSGGSVAVAGGMGAWIYELDSMLPVQYLNPGSPVSDIAWSPDGNHIALAGQNGLGSVWDVQTGENLFSLVGHAGSLQAITWSPDSSRLATAGFDSSLRTWSAETGSVLRTTTDITGGTVSLAWSPQGMFLASGSMDGTVRLWDADQLVMQQLIGRHTEGVDEVIWSPDGSRLISGGRDGRLRLWDIERGVEILDLLAFGFSVPGLAWSPEGDRIVEAGGLGHLGNVGVWDLGLEEEIDAIDDIFLDFVVDVDWSLDGSRIVAGTRRGTLVLWDAETGQLLHESRPHAYHATGLSWSPNGDQVSSSTTEGIVQLWNVRTAQEQNWGFIDAPAQSVSWSPDGTYLLVSATDGKGYLLDSIDLDDLEAYRSGEEFAYDAAWSSDGALFALAAEGGSLSVWNLSNNQRLAALEGHLDDVNAVAWSPTSQWLASVGNDMRLMIWDAQALIAIQEFELPAAHQCLAWSPDGDYLALGGLDGVLRLWEREGETVRQLVQPESGIVSLAWTKDGSLLAAGLDDGSLRFYRLEDGSELLNIPAHNATVTGLGFSPDGTSIATTSMDGAIKLWRLP